jgi:hypothetical protein
MFMHGSWLHIIGNMVFLWAMAGMPRPEGPRVRSTRQIHGQSAFPTGRHLGVVEE